MAQPTDGLMHAYTTHEARAKAHRTPRSHGGERGGDGPEREVSGFGRPLRGGGVRSGVRWSQIHMSYRPAALRRSRPPPDYKRGEKRLVFATPEEPCTTYPTKLWLTHTGTMVICRVRGRIAGQRGKETTSRGSGQGGGIKASGGHSTLYSTAQYW